jgi:sarcosine oxidase subunit alpha
MTMPRRPVIFYFENQPLQGIEGEPVAKALFTAGIKTLSWSVKYKRPRGIHCARGRCIMCHMEVDGVPGVPTCLAPLREGMSVRRENFKPFFAPLLISAVNRLRFPAGFYYRMFTRPAFLRKLFLGSLRRMAGVGRIVVNGPQPQKTARPAVRSPADSYEVVVVGAGLSGMSAALAAANRGARVLLVDEYGRPGGHSIGYQADSELVSQRDQCVTQVEFSTSIDYCPRTTAQAFYPPDTLLLGPGGALALDQTFDRSTVDKPSGRVALAAGMKKVRAKSFIFATGAYDVIPIFQNSDLPGVFGPRAIRLLLERDRLKPGHRAVVYGVGTALRDVTALLVHHDIQIVAVVDADPNPAGGVRRALPDGTRWIQQGRVVRADGGQWLTSITASGRDRRAGRTSTERLSCDLLCTAFAGQGAYELPYQAGFRFELSEDPVHENRVLFPDKSKVRSGPVTCFAVGEVAGQQTWQQKMTAAEESGNKALQSLET